MLDMPIPVNVEVATIRKVRVHLQRLRSDGIGYVTAWFVKRLEWERQSRIDGAKVS